jgi:GT2 family glycosyltransferase
MSDVTVAFVFRERISPTVEKLTALIERTTSPHRLIVFDNATPPRISRELARLRDAHGFLLLRSEEVLSPNAQRNRCLAEVDTRFVVFVDNDVDVNENWLEPLVSAAVETNAGLVAPLYLERMKGQVRIHLWDGVVRTEGDDGRRMFQERHHLAHADLASHRAEIGRRDGGLVEFHAVLVDTELLRSLGGLDPRLMSLSEHAHLSVQVLRAGRRIFLEPASVVTYDIPARLDPVDREYFLLRWSETWNRVSVERLAELYGLAPDDPDLQGVFYWGRFHRQRATIRVRGMRRFVGEKGEAFAKRVAHALEWRQNERKFPLRAVAVR